MSVRSKQAHLGFATSSNWRTSIKRLPGVQHAIDLNVLIEDRWFDFHHNVDTKPALQEQQRRGWPEDKINFHYLPIRPKCVRRALTHLPEAGRDEYTFIDFGSGKGRALLVAATMGFNRLRGIELRRELHEQACMNFERRRHLDGASMESVNMDASEYDFPNEKLVLFFFNPFGNDVMAKVVQKLSESLDTAFRDVWVVLHESTCSHLVDAAPQLRLEAEQDGCRVYRSYRHQANGVDPLLSGQNERPVEDRSNAA